MAKKTNETWNKTASDAYSGLTAPTYTASDTTNNYLSQLNSMEGQQPTYTSQYQNQLNSIMDKISNRADFTYDFNADPLYQQYKDQYTTQGKLAANNAASAASTLTGGYGNSYATTAAAQANQQYLTELNNVIPELYNAALNKYNTETENLYNQYNMYGNAEDRAFSQYQTALSQFNTNRDYYSGRYDASTANDQWNYNKDYTNYRDTVEDNQWAYDTDYNSYINDRNYNYQKEQDAIANKLNQAEFDLSYEQWLWQKQQAENKASSSGSGSSKKSSSSSKKKVSDDIDYSGGNTTTTNNDLFPNGSKLDLASKTDAILAIKNSGDKTGNGLHNDGKVTYSEAALKNYKATIEKMHSETGKATKFIKSLYDNNKITDKQYDTFMAMIS